MPPLLLTLARRAPYNKSGVKFRPPLERSLSRMRVLTAIPVYNEERHVERVLEEVRRHAGDILVINDGSTDRTAELLAGVPGIQVITHPQNRGYGSALISAFSHTVEHGY